MYNNFSTYKELDLNEMGKRIRERREYLDLSREALASKVGLSAKFISDIEYGNKGISIKKLFVLAQALTTSIDYLMGGIPSWQGEDDDIRNAISNRIMGTLSGCNNEQLKCFEKMSEIYLDGIKTNKDGEKN